MAFWVDEIAEQIAKTIPEGREIILRDEKTASGKVHIGSLRGVIIHGVLAEALNQMGRKATFHYEINDVDPMDGLPVYLDKEGYAPYMGMPLKDIPAPDENGKPAGEVTKENNFARHYGNEFIEVIRKLGFNEENHTQFPWASDFYEAGHYDEWIEKACAHPDKVREVYKRTSGSIKENDWNPLQIVCEKCGKVGTTTVTEFDGKEAAYRCEKEKVVWAEGCGHEGKVSPFKGRGKLPWKMEWAVKWAGFPRPDGDHGVDVEGSGKDHNAAGGSHDVSSAICEEVLAAAVPFNVPYEFFLFGGAKMSASKGLGATAKEVSDMMPPELLRFLMVRTSPQKPIDFNIDGDTIPRLYDNHDECAAIHFGAESDTPDLGRAFHFAQLSPENIPERYFPRFSRVAFMVQIPYLDVHKEIEKMKEAPLTDADKAEADERSEYAKVWLENFASDHAKFEIQDDVPDLAHDLEADQRAFLKSIAEFLTQNPDIQGENLHGQIHELRKNSPLEPRDAFGAIYVSLLGKPSGPQAGWFLESLDRPFVIKRFEEVAKLKKREKAPIEDLKTPTIIIRKDVREQFPGIKLGFNTLKGVKITQSPPEIDQIRNGLWSGLDFKELRRNSPRLEAYREMFRNFGVKPSTNKPSPVALISRLANGKELPNINIAVDLYNALVVKHQISIGIFNLDALKLPVDLAFAKGGEMFHGLGAKKEVPVNAGELCYFDSASLMMARDFNYYDSEISKANENTTNLLLNVDGNDACTMEDVEECLAELETLLVKYCGGELGERVLVESDI